MRLPYMLTLPRAILLAATALALTSSLVPAVQASEQASAKADAARRMARGRVNM